MRIPKLLTFAAIAVLGTTAVYADNDRGKGEDERDVVEFHTMVAVPRPYVGSANPIRGIAGGGLPWVLKSAHGSLEADGHLHIVARGLVLDPNDAAVIQAGLAGQNPVNQMRGIVSCQSTDASGAPTMVNLMTNTFPATTGLASQGGGDVSITAFLQLPKPCIAPIVFVTSPAGAWFAATGL